MEGVRFLWQAPALRMHCFEDAAGAARLWRDQLRDLCEKFRTSAYRK